MPDSQRGRVWLPTLAALVALLAFVPQAGATEDYESEQEATHTVKLGLFIKAADAETRMVEAKIRCTGTQHDGTVVGLAVGEGVDMSALVPGAEIGAEVDKSTDPKTIVSLLEDDCPVHDEPDYPKPEPKPEADDGEDADALPEFGRGFLTRVWKFIGEVDSYEEGELSITLGKILNIPKKFRSQDDDLLDQDAMVLVSERARVFQDGRRVSRDDLDAANNVRVHGKLLRPAQWRTDEDGSPVPTIRAKKVYITD